MQEDIVVNGEVFPIRDNYTAGREFVKWKDRESTRVAFCAQRPWIVASSVKANIVLAAKDFSTTTTTTHKDAVVDSEGISLEGGEEEEDFKHPLHIDRNLYQEAISMCKLQEDFALWPERDDTEIGERGVSVSGV